MFVRGFPSSLFACNCYVVASDNQSQAIIIDPGWQVSNHVHHIVTKHQLIPIAILLTHGHLDHILSASQLGEKYHCPVYIHQRDRELLTRPAQGFSTHFSSFFLDTLAKTILKEPSQLIEIHHETHYIHCENFGVDVVHTPGHTPGSVIYQISGDFHQGISEVVFTGDLLFKNSVGRTDLPGGSGRDLMNSIITKVLILDDTTVVLPGHGPSTTVGAERHNNPFLEGLT